MHFKSNLLIKNFKSNHLNKKGKNIAVSETIGTILLLGISVSLFSIIYVSVLTISPSPLSPTANLICTIDDENNNLIIEHRGGKTLSLDTNIKTVINNTDNTIAVKDYLNFEALNNGVWNLGERVVYHIEKFDGENISNEVVKSNISNVDNNIDKGFEIGFVNCTETVPDNDVMVIQETTGSYIDHNNIVDNNNSNVDSNIDMGTEIGFANCTETVTDNDVMIIQEETIGVVIDNDNADDNTCNIDSISDKGSESGFVNSQNTIPDSNVMTLQENNMGGPAVDEYLYVNSMSNTYLEWDGTIGSTPYINAVDGTSYIHEQKTSNVKEGWFSFDDTTQTGTGYSVKFDFYIYGDDSDDTITVYYDTDNNGYDSYITFTCTRTGSYAWLSASPTYIFTATQINNMRIYITYNAVNGGDDIYIDACCMHITRTEVIDYELDMEYQFNNVKYNYDNEYICLYLTGTITENLLIFYYNSGWINLGTISNLGWNNFTATGLTSTTYNIRLTDNNQTYETTQHSWTIDVLKLYMWNESKNYINLEYQWTDLIYSDSYEQLCIYITSSTGIEDLIINYWNSNNWVNIGTITGIGWYNFTAIGLTSNTYTIQILGSSETFDTYKDNWSIDCMFIHTYNNTKCQIDFEYQWNNINNNNINEQVWIYVKSHIGTEALNINYWNGNSWVNIGTITSSSIGWNKFTAQGLTSNSYTIQLIGTSEIVDTVKDSWSIDCILLHTYNGTELEDKNISVYVIDTQSNSVIMMTNIKE